jgi:hypothetical protein
MGSIHVDETQALRPDRRPNPVARPARPEAPPHEDAEIDRVLKMVEAGQLSAHDADELLRAMGRV